MNNLELRRMAAQIGLASVEKERVRLALGAACVGRCAHLLELQEAKALHAQMQRAIATGATLASLSPLAQAAQDLARAHPGSASIDGSGHSAVSATHALAHALAGRALDAAEYSAYALVYSYGRYAVQDPESFAPEFEWQVRQLAAIP